MQGGAVTSDALGTKPDATGNAASIQLPTGIEITPGPAGAAVAAPATSPSPSAREPDLIRPQITKSMRAAFETPLPEKHIMPGTDGKTESAEPAQKNPMFVDVIPHEAQMQHASRVPKPPRPQQPPTLDESSRREQPSAPTPEAGTAPEPIVSFEEATEEKPFEKKSGVSPIRTYRDDALRIVKEKGESRVSIAAAEARRRAPKRDIQKEILARRAHDRRMRRIMFASIALVALGGAALGALYFLRGTESVQTPRDVQYLITAELEAPAFIPFGDNIIMDELVNARRNTDLARGSIAHVRALQPTRAGGDNASARLMPVSLFLSSLADAVPNRFVRSVSGEYLFGFHQTETLEPFIILKTTDYENAFGALLEWEENMYRDLSPLFGEKRIPARAGSSAATSTDGLIRLFEDDVKNNRDVRILYAQDGSEALLYAFPDRGTIIITTNTDTFLEIISRLAAVRTLR